MTLDVLATYAEELARHRAAPASEAKEVARLLAELDAQAKSPKRKKPDSFYAERRAALEQRRDAPQQPAELQAWRGTRTRLHAALQGENPLPRPAPGEDEEVTAARQKAHDKKLWQRVDELVAAAGITEGGRT